MRRDAFSDKRQLFDHAASINFTYWNKHAEYTANKYAEYTAKYTAKYTEMNMK